MSNIIPLVLIGLSLAGILTVVGRRFSALANLDVDSIPEEKEAKFKERLAGARIKRSLTAPWKRISRSFRGSKGRLQRMEKRLKELRDSYEREEKAPAAPQKEERINRLFRELEELDRWDDYGQYESKLIEIIGLDSKNARAFEELSDLYFENKRYGEAEQTYTHALKLLPEEDNEHKGEICFNLALVAKERGNMETAWKNIKEAAEFSPNNPRFLDTMIEISIMKKDKASAEKAYKRLAEVNPENKKLEEWKNNIEEL